MCGQYKDMEICPDCKEHCEAIDEEEDEATLGSMDRF